MVHAGSLVIKAHSHGVQGKAEKRRNSEPVSSFSNAAMNVVAKRSITEFSAWTTSIAVCRANARHMAVSSGHILPARLREAVFAHCDDFNHGFHIDLPATDLPFILHFSAKVYVPGRQSWLPATGLQG